MDRSGSSSRLRRLLPIALGASAALAVLTYAGSALNGSSTDQYKRTAITASEPLVSGNAAPTGTGVAQPGAVTGQLPAGVSSLPNAVSNLPSTAQQSANTSATGTGAGSSQPSSASPLAGLGGVTNGLAPLTGNIPVVGSALGAHAPAGSKPTMNVAGLPTDSLAKLQAPNISPSLPVVGTLPVGGLLP
jgi:uncharacterized phage infection (PIP) family protein YhgE